MRYDAGKRLDAGAFAAVESWLPSRPRGHRRRLSADRGPMSLPPSRSHSLYMSDYRRHAMTHENEDARA